MQRLFTPGILVALALLAAAVAPAPAKRGTWYDPYLDGIEALEAGDAARAVELFETALSRRAESGYHRTYGTNYIHYAPHARLAVAWHALGDCGKALAELERAEAAGELTDDPALVPRSEVVRRACAPPPPASAAEASRTSPEHLPPALDPALLERGITAYLAGDLETSERVFSRVANEAPDSAVGQLLLATVRFARWSTGGRRDEALAEEARQALARARALDPLLAPPPALCPPELLALWNDRP